LTRECVNSGGPGSFIRLAGVPQLEFTSTLSADGVQALGRWRARPGEVLTVIDPEQVFYRARIVRTGPDAEVVPFERCSRPVESPLALDIYQALPEKERFELILQKLTEIGVSRIVPYVSNRSITLDERDALQKKSHRWPEVVLKAAKQCRRAMIPELYPVLTWDEAIYLAARADLKLVLYEGDTPWTLGERVRGGAPHRTSLFVGPEGGFDPSEVEDARTFGFLPVSVGPRILRTETAAIVAAALLQFSLGDMG
jgi:16S rRNA (uracil1498-N3)-methyltransferase